MSRTPMKLILTQEVSGLGAPGDVVDVAAGYGRNYLIPRGFAMGWTRGAEKQIELIKRAEELQVDIIAFPELAVTGYPPEDLVLKPEFIRDNLRELDRIIASVGDLTAIVGFVDADGADVPPPEELKPLSAYKIDSGYRKLVTDEARLTELRKRLGSYVKR